MTPDEALARIRRYDGRLHAFVQVFDPPLGEVQADGPTVAVKDLIDIAGQPTGGGGRIPLDPSPERHAEVVQRLLAAGCRIVGKTHTVELAYGGWGTNRAVGAPWNPWDAKVHRAPGGSSSGSAVAVAAGLCDAALGTDTGGSVRIPAAMCGVVGLKPGRGLVSLAGVQPLSPSLDSVGTLARSVSVAARLLALIAGGDERPVFDVEAALSRDVSGLVCAALPRASLENLEPDVAQVVSAAVARLQDAGVTVVEAEPPELLEGTFAANGWLMAAEGWRVRAAHIEAARELMDPWIVQRFEAGRDITDARLAAILEQRAHDQAAFAASMSRFDALLMPTCPIAAPRLDQVDETVSPLSRLTRAANYLDLPAASVPCGLTREGLPVGLQIMGRPRDEATVVSLAAAFERVSGWDGRAPDLSGFG